jgi:hypothetical protein
MDLALKQSGETKTQQAKTECVNRYQNVIKQYILAD